jgi:hypothetical protein
MYILAWGIDVSSPLVGYWGFSIKIRNHIYYIFEENTEEKENTICNH